MTNIGLSKEEIEKKVEHIYPTPYERDHKIKIIKREKKTDEPLLMSWEIEKSDKSKTHVFTLRLGLYINRWTPLIFITKDQAESLKKIIKEYDSINSENGASRCQ